MGILRETSIHFWSYLAQFFLEWEMFHTKVVQKIKTHILCSVTFFPENRAVYEIMWKNIVQRGRAQMAIWRMRIACWIPKAKNTLRIRTTYCASVLCYTHVVCPVEPPDQLHQHDISHMSNCTQTSAHFNTSTHVTARPICSVYCL